MELNAEVSWNVFNVIPGPILALDDARKIVFANRAAFNLLGDTIEGEDISMALRQPAALALAEAALAGDRPAPGEIKISKGASQTFEIRASPIDGDSFAKVIIAMDETTFLRQAEDIRSTFVANVSHELRSPLTSLVGFIETLRGAAKDDPAAQAKFLNIMEDEAARMARLIDDLLSLSSVEADEHIQPREHVQLIPLLSRVISLLQTKVKEKRINIDTDFSKNIPDVKGDDDQLTQVFQNLLDNAVKYGRPDSMVKVEVKLREKFGDNRTTGVSVCISDQSDGIPADDLSRLTERFYRVDKARSRELGGTGLGLAIVKHIVGRHRGRLEIDSEEGVGSEFIVTLPVVDAGA